MNSMSTLPERAKEFAIKAHGDQKRKYTGLPYWVHLAEVANLVASIGGDDEMIAAAWLHDTVEDTNTGLDVICSEFGPRVASLVEDLTDVSKPTDGNRATRKAFDRRHTGAGSPDAKTIKLADLISNTADIRKNDPDFAKVYIAEKELLMPLLVAGDPVLYSKALDQVWDSKRDVGLRSLPPSLQPRSMWLVEYEYRDAVITVSAKGDGFFACGQEPLWPFSCVQKWIHEVKPPNENTGSN